MIAPTNGEFRGTPRFQVIERLGQGGMGVVYRALDKQRNTEVALKTLRTLSADAVLRFKNEFRALQDLQHPNLVSLGEMISEGGQWFFTMELVDGIDFLSWVRRSTAPQTQAETLPPGWSGRFVAGEPTVIDHAPASLPQLDEPRLRQALAELARGVAALHDAHKVHRDIKPSNILVTGEGRVVLLDFGLATDVTAPQPFSDVHVVGTADYMAPEQAASKPVGPEADWYSVGVVLYEALTGRVPFAGAPLEVLMNKQRHEPPRVRALVPASPQDLDALCADLLRFDPQARPSGRQVLRRLGEHSETGLIRVGATASSSGSPPFVGRSRELGLLTQAYEHTLKEHTVAVLVQGESGVGKSSLVRRFTERLSGSDRESVVLAGRCYERESVPYKALDGVVDALSRFLSRLSTADAAALLPRRAGLLAHVFPVLRRVEAVTQAPAPQLDGIDPQEQRVRVFEALRELLIRLTQKRRLVVVIDDLQWADADSLALLAEVLRPPDAPPLLLLATLRDRHLELPGDVRSLQVPSLPPDEAAELASLLMRRAPTGDNAQAIAEEARGHPLFIDELVRHSIDGNRGTTKLHLEEALGERVSRLDPPARELLEMIVVAGGPLSQDTAAYAAAMDFAEFTRRVSYLRVANLVRTTASRGLTAVEPYHDRVRAAVLRRLDPAPRRMHHQRLALALEASERADPEALYAHWLGAGDGSRAAQYAARAAEQAAHALAFQRAARLFRIAIDLQAADAPQARELQTRLGETLANAGRGGQAAQAYLAAALSAQGAESLDLQRRAAEQLLLSGHTDQGLAALSSVLGALKMALPATPSRAIASLMWRRLRVRLRGLEFRRRDPSELSAKDLSRIDICWSVACSLGMVDFIRGVDYQTRHLLLALDAGEPFRIARALAVEAGFSAVGGAKNQTRTDHLLERAKALAEESGDPRALAWVVGVQGFAGLQGGRFREALTCSDRALQLLRDRCTGVTWELDTVQLQALWALSNLGEIKELTKRLFQALKEAEGRGDLYLATPLRSGSLSMVWLARDDPEGARREIAVAKRQWKREQIDQQNLHWLTSSTHVDLYTGDAARAHQTLTERLPAFERILSHVRISAVEAVGLRARAAVAASILPGANKQPLLASAVRDLRRISTDAPAYALAQARLLQAGIAAARGDRTQAIVELRAAVAGLDASEQRLLAAVARYRLGELLGSSLGGTLCQDAVAKLEQEEVANPLKLIALFAPGFAP